jgi:molecular chaperone DnaK
VPKIDVTFDIDADGILNVTAKDMATQKSQSIRITGSTRLPEAEKQRMINQAEHFAQQDKKRRDEAEKLNSADSVCYQAERTLADFGAKLSDDLRRRIESALRETREALGKRDAALASRKADALKAVLQEAGQALYAQAPGPQPRPDVGPSTGEPRPAGAAAGGRVVDAEYREASGRTRERAMVSLGRAARLLRGAWRSARRRREDDQGRVSTTCPEVSPRPQQGTWSK